MQPRWSRAAKNAIGTAYSSASHVWFTIANGCLSEVYHPTIDQPQIRDLQFLVVDDAGNFQEERRDLAITVGRLPEDALGASIVTSDPGGRYRFVKQYIADPHQNAVLIRVSLEGDAALVAGLRVFVLCAPHLNIGGWHNNAAVIRSNDRDLLLAWRENTFCVLGASTPFRQCSVGYVGTSDGYQDIAAHKKMTWGFDLALDGNVAMTAELDLRVTRAFTLALAFGDTSQNAISTLFQSLSLPFEQTLQRFTAEWKRATHHVAGISGVSNRSDFFQRSVNLLLAHEDKSYPGAVIASMSIPWGDMKGDEELGGYHLVWCRDLYQAATALLATGHRATPLRALIYLSISQRPDGGFPQNFWIDGRSYWSGVQLDEVSFPVMLAWRLWSQEVLQDFDPLPMVRRALAFLIRNGPATAQERWEELAGYSPSTLAATITSLICGASMLRAAGDESTALFVEQYADFLESHIEAWTVTRAGSLAPGIRCHYIRATPVFDDPDGFSNEDPDLGAVTLSNQPPGARYQYPAREIVDAGFLELVRYGIRAPNSELMADSLQVVDRLLKVETPKGPCWRRYNHDGYGQRSDGSGYDGWGVGRAWPLLTGERGHYELAAGRTARPYIEAMEAFAVGAGLIPEQVWDQPQLPGGYFQLGDATNAAVPLMWAHAEYIKLVESSRVGTPVDRFEPVYQRYVASRKAQPLEIWAFSRRPRKVMASTPLRIIAAANFRLRWSKDGWKNVHDADATRTQLGIYYFDLPLDDSAPATLRFTFYWPEAAKWEGRDYSVELCAATRETQSSAASSFAPGLRCAG